MTKPKVYRHQLEVYDEHEAVVKEYNALKLMLGEMLLEHNKEECAEDIAYYTRKFNEARLRVGGKNASQVVR